ncbi:MAG: flagellar biosynthetic protein FliO [Pseudomonadota bacterium]
MEALDYMRALAALLFVLALLWGGLWLLKRYGGQFLREPGSGDEKNMAVLERLDLPHRKSLLRVKVGKREHTLLVSATGEQLVESRDYGPPSGDAL